MKAILVFLKFEKNYSLCWISGLLPHFGEQRIILLLYKVILFYSFFDPYAEIYTLLLRIDGVL